MSWASDYVGIPHAELGRDRHGIDCYGLFRLILSEQQGIDLPAYAGAYTCAAERAELATLIAGGMRVGPWHQATDVRPFDGLLFRINGHASHIACAIDTRRMIHVHTDQSKIARLSDPSWSSRLVGVWRHERLVA